MYRLKEFATQLARSERGAGVMELALAAPLIAFAAISAFDIMQGYAFKLSLEQAAQRATDLAIVRKPPGDDSSDVAYLENEVTEAAPGTEPAVELYVTCDGERFDDYEHVCPAETEVARYVMITVAGNYEPMFGYIGFLGDEYPVRSVRLVGNSSVRIQ